MKRALLQAVCSVAEGTADVIVDGGTYTNIKMITGVEDVSLCRAADVVAEALRSKTSFSMLGGQEDMPRSLGSVYCCTVLQFIGSAPPFTGTFVRNIDVPENTKCVALSNDGAKLFTTCKYVFRDTPTVRIFRVSDGVLLREIAGSAFRLPAKWASMELTQMCEAPDGYLYIASVKSARFEPDQFDRHRVTVFTPRYEYHAVHNFDRSGPISGLCANDEVLVVHTAAFSGCLHVLPRGKGAAERRSFEKKACLDRCSLSFLPDQCHVVDIVRNGFLGRSAWVVIQSLLTGEITQRIPIFEGIYAIPASVRVSADNVFIIACRGQGLRKLAADGSTTVVDGTVHTFSGLAMCGTTLAAKFGYTRVAIYK